MSNSAMSVVILAAGKGTRMYSDLPKVLHTLAGKPMVQHVIDAANDLGACAVHLVYGHGGDLLRQTLHEDNLNWVLQAEQLGTGHAMQQAAPFFNDDEDILMLYGDVPLISVETLQRLRAAKPQGGIGLLTVKLDDPTGYGRITRENGQVTGIVEHKDASEAQRQIQEINTGILIAGGADLKRWLAKLTNNNAQGEYYITDIIAMAHQEGHQIVAVHPQRLSEVEGVNNRLQLARLERVYQAEQAEKLLLAGVLQRTAQIETRRIAQHHARQQQFFCLLGLVNTLQAGELKTVIYPFSFANTRRMYRRNLTPFLVGHRNDVGDVVFTLRVVIGQFRQPAFHVRAIGNQDPGVDLLNPALFLAGIFMLNDAGHFAVFTGDATIAARVVQHDGQQTDAALGFSFTQASQGFNGDQRDITVEH